MVLSAELSSYASHDLIINVYRARLIMQTKAKSRIGFLLSLLKFEDTFAKYKICCLILLRRR